MFSTFRMSVFIDLSFDIDVSPTTLELFSLIITSFISHVISFLLLSPLILSSIISLDDFCVFCIFYVDSSTSPEPEENKI